MPVTSPILNLRSNTAQLPSVPLEAPPDSLGTNTIHSIQSGIVLGYKGLVEFLIERMRTDMCAKTGGTADSIKIIATGGLNSVLKPITSVFQTVDKQLTLKGEYRCLYDGHCKGQKRNSRRKERFVRNL